jgi:aspartyl aminopeptidase
LPAGDRTTAVIKKKAAARPITAQTIDNGTPEVSMLSARKIMIESG